MKDNTSRWMFGVSRNTNFGLLTLIKGTDSL